MVKAVVNLGVMPPLSDWQVVDSNPTAGMSGIGFFLSREEISMVFPRRKCFVFTLYPTRLPHGLFVAAKIVVNCITFKV